MIILTTSDEGDTARPMSLDEASRCSAPNTYIAPVSLCLDESRYFPDFVHRVANPPINDAKGFPIYTYTEQITPAHVDEDWLKAGITSSVTETVGGVMAFRSVELVCYGARFESLADLLRFIITFNARLSFESESNVRYPDGTPIFTLFINKKRDNN